MYIHIPNSIHLHLNPLTPWRIRERAPKFARGTQQPVHHSRLQSEMVISGSLVRMCCCHSKCRPGLLCQLGSVAQLWRRFTELILKFYAHSYFKSQMNTPALSGRVPEAEDALGNVIPQGRQYLAVNFLCNQKACLQFLFYNNILVSDLNLSMF